VGLVGLDGAGGGGPLPVSGVGELAGLSGSGVGLVGLDGAGGGGPLPVSGVGELAGLSGSGVGLGDGVVDSTSLAGVPGETTAGTAEVADTAGFAGTVGAGAGAGAGSAGVAGFAGPAGTAGTVGAGGTVGASGVANTAGAVGVQGPAGVSGAGVRGDSSGRGVRIESEGAAGAGQVSGAGVDVAAFERSWGKLAEGERLDRALWQARQWVAGGVPAPLSLDGNEPFDRLTPAEQLVRRVALHLYHGETDTAQHLAATPHATTTLPSANPFGAAAEPDAADSDAIHQSSVDVPLNPHYAPGIRHGEGLAAYAQAQHVFFTAQETVRLMREHQQGGQGPSYNGALNSAEARLEQAKRDAATSASGLTDWERHVLSVHTERIPSHSGLPGGKPKFFIPKKSDGTPYTYAAASGTSSAGPSGLLPPPPPLTPMPSGHSIGESSPHSCGAPGLASSSILATAPAGPTVNPYIELEWKAFPNARTFITESAAMDYGNSVWRSHLNRLRLENLRALRRYTAHPFPGMLPTQPYRPSFQEMKALSRDHSMVAQRPVNFYREAENRYPAVDGSGDRIVQTSHGVVRVSRFDFLREALHAAGRDFNLLMEALRVLPVPEDLVVTKGVSMDYISIPWVQCVGHTFTETAFMSTSLGPPEIDRSVVLHLMVPRGTEGLFIAGVSDFPHERELLLAPGQRWVARHVKSLGDKIHVFGEILPRHP
ncbi:ADP-ribosyltransferase, partial [Streptomyces nigra]|uniref:ADP-ribosyltransferase n=1 Tax=Streptomyces nigra TaxID=1827580 RepID=UPI0037D97414